MRQIGLHLRIMTNLLDMVAQAVRLNLQIFQCFFVHQVTGLYLEPDDDEIKQFRLLREKYFDTLYVHGSYWMNLAGPNYENTLHTLKREFTLAHQLGFNTVVLHPGSWSGSQTKSQGIDTIARVLNAVCQREAGITILLENMAFGQKTIGSDLTDFQELRKKIDKPEMIKFCIDTAHAFAYGYNIIDPHEQKKFIQLIETTLGAKAVKLLHINDTQEKLASKRDKHDAVGKGSIGVDALRSFMLQPELAEIPCILELPELAEDEQKHYLDLVRSWH